MLSLANLIWIVYLINFAIIIMIVCFQKRNPIASMAWLLCFMLFPVVGGIVFLIFGVGINTVSRRKYQKKLELNEKYLIERQKKTVPKDKDGIISYFLNSNCIYSENNEVEFFTDANEKYKSLLKDIEKAEEYINVSYYIIQNDESGNAFIDALTKKAEEGVKVRLMYDGLGTLLTPKRMFDRLRNTPNSEVVEFFPVRVFPLSKINHRNHRKIVIIDGNILYMGGMNIGDEYANKSPKWKLTWRDTHIKIIGEAAECADKTFKMDWEFSTGKQIKNDSSYEHIEIEEKIPMQIVPSGPDSRDEEIKCGMIKMINAAKKYVYIQTPYFVPDQTFLTALIMAKNSNVDVRVMIPGVPDKKYVYHTTMSYVGELLEAGIKVYLYPGFIHSKTITVDDRLLTVGSANADIRSFRLLFEINTFMYSETASVKHRKIFENDMKKCKRITMEEYQKRGIVKTVLEGLFRLFSPIM